MTADAACTCTMTDPRTWTRYGSAVEPGSMLEPNPDCPEHFPKTDAAGVSERERLVMAIMMHPWLEDRAGNWPKGYCPTCDKGIDAGHNSPAHAIHIADAILAAGFGDVAAIRAYYVAEIERQGDLLRGDVSQAKADALEEAAKAWIRGQWANAPRLANRVAERIANGQHVGDWLLARAAKHRS